MKKLVLIAAMAMAGNTFALTSRLAFQVRSSGPDAFACNAGIRHAAPAHTVKYSVGGAACIDCDHNGMATETGTYTYTEGENNPYANGVYFPDVMHTRWSVYNPTTGLGALGGMITTNAWVNGNWVPVKGAQFYDSGMDADLMAASDLANDSSLTHRTWNGSIRENNVLGSLVFLFSSEQYGTEYFVDICNYEPETYCGSGDCAVSNGDVSGEFEYKSLISGTDMSPLTLSYLTLSGLKAEVKLSCDGGAVTTVPVTSLTPSLAQVNFIQSIIGKKCVTRFIFREKTTAMRVNQLQKACFEVMTEINEPTVE